MSLICIDAGTTVIKAVRYDDSGREAGVARASTRILRPRAGWAEQDMAEVWTAAHDVVRELLADGPAPTALSVTAQGDGAWLVDSDGAPTGPAMLWNDGRAHDVVAAWEKSGVIEEGFAIHGSRISTGMPNALLAWLRSHDPQRLRDSASVLTCGGWIFGKLTGQWVMDTSDASAPFLDVRTRDWSSRLLELYGIADLSRLLPELRGDEHRVSGLRAEVAQSLGLPADLPVVMAPYDICSTALGAGAVATGDACVILGTTLATEVVIDEVPSPDAETEPSGITVTLGAPDRWLRAFPTMAGGDVLEWVSRLLGTADVPELFSLAEQAQPKAAGVRFLPYLSPAGERAPFFAPSARGSLTGLSMDAGREDVARAVVEGLTMTVRDCLAASGQPPSRLSLCGGGAASDLWAGLIADVTGVPVVRGHDTQVGARGAQLVSLVATGAEPDLETAAAAYVSTSEPIEPDPVRTAGLEERYKQFLALRETLAPTWTAEAVR